VLEAALGTTPYRWTVERGALPPGLRLGRDGALEGVPRWPGRWTFAIRVMDAGRPPMTDRHTFTLTVGAGGPPAVTARGTARAGGRGGLVQAGSVR
jgi:Putative Ig domain